MLKTKKTSFRAGYKIYVLSGTQTKDGVERNVWKEHAEMFDYLADAQRAAAKAFPGKKVHIEGSRLHRIETIGRPAEV